jgi:hypothetical protein
MNLRRCRFKKCLDKNSKGTFVTSHTHRAHRIKQRGINKREEAWDIEVKRRRVEGSYALITVFLLFFN